MKLCHICKKLKPAGAFYKNRSKKDGRAGECKHCCNHYRKVLVCDGCGDPFTIKHRNLRRRKTRKCPTCAAKHVVLKNKQRAGRRIYSTKGYEYVRDQKSKCGYVFNHRRKLEEHLGRKLTREEVVHHIDNDRLNNTVKNLFLTNGSGHRFAHKSLEEIGFLLLRRKIVKFDRAAGVYKLTKQAKL